MPLPRLALEQPSSSAGRSPASLPCSPVQGNWIWGFQPSAMDGFHLMKLLVLAAVLLLAEAASAKPLR